MLITKTVDLILEYIESKIEREIITIESLVVYSGYSRRYLQVIFKRHVGIPVGIYIQLRRVTRSAAYLRLTNHKLSDIAGLLCYDSQQTFNREFKKHTGYTPKLFRDMNIWNFKKQTGFRSVMQHVSIPELVELPEINITGESFFYKINIPFIYGGNNKKWKYVQQRLRNEGSACLLLLNGINASGKSAVVDVFIVDDNGKENANIQKYVYASFFFQGRFEDYERYVYDINVNMLPHHGLQRLLVMKDIEIIQKKDANIYSFEYFIPVRKLC